MHTKLYKEKYPKECDFCDDMIESGKEMDLHLKYNHNGRNAAYKCEDCDFIGENGCSLYIMENVIIQILSVDYVITWGKL